MPLRMQATIVLGRLSLLALEYSGGVSYKLQQQTKEQCSSRGGRQIWLLCGELMQLRKHGFDVPAILNDYVRLDGGYFVGVCANIVEWTRFWCCYCSGRMVLFQVYQAAVIWRQRCCVWWLTSPQMCVGGWNATSAQPSIPSTKMPPKMRPYSI